MEDKQIKCPKCEGEMLAGSFIEKSNPLGGALRENYGVTWGNIKSSIWKTSVKNEKRIVVYRCTSCGFLESYAK